MVRFQRIVGICLFLLVAATPAWSIGVGEMWKEGRRVYVLIA